MKLLRLSKEGLIEYTARQLEHFFPDGYLVDRGRLSSNLSETLERLGLCINSVRMWCPDQFDHLHSSQYCIYIYLLSNTIWRNHSDAELATRLFLLNKALNGIDCFYEIDMPEIFFIGHSSGIVLAKAQYSNYLVLYQNSTVGKNHGVAPVIGERVVMYPNTAIIGRCMVKPNTVLSQGTGLVNADTPGNCVAFIGQNGRPLFKAPSRDIVGDIFRLS